MKRILMFISVATLILWTPTMVTGNHQKWIWRSYRIEFIYHASNHIFGWQKTITKKHLPLPTSSLCNFDIKWFSSAPTIATRPCFCNTSIHISKNTDPATRNLRNCVTHCGVVRNWEVQKFWQALVFLGNPWLGWAGKKQYVNKSTPWN